MKFSTKSRKQNSIQILDLCFPLKQHKGFEDPYKGIITPFNQCIDKLDEIKEIKLTYKMSNFVDEFSNLAKALFKKKNF